MRPDLNKSIYVPNLGSPLYYTDLSVLAFSWYLARLKRAGAIHLEFAPSIFNNMALTTRSNFFMLHSEVFVELCEYFLDKPDFDYRSIRNDYNWPVDRSTEETQKTYDGLCNAGARVWCIKYMQTFMLAQNYATILGKRKYYEYEEILKVDAGSYGSPNPFIDEVIACANESTHIALFLNFLVTVPAPKLSMVATPVNNRQEWLKPMVSSIIIDSLNIIQLNPTPVADWLMFNE